MISATSSGPAVDSPHEVLIEYLVTVASPAR
jgi:hypothetical protein